MGQVKKMETIKANNEFISATETKATEKVKSADTIDFDAYNTVEVESMSVTESGKLKYDSDFLDIDYVNADISAIPSIWNLSFEQLSVLIDTLINNPGKYQIAYKNGRLAIKRINGINKSITTVYDEHGKVREKIWSDNNVNPSNCELEEGIRATSKQRIEKYKEDGSIHSVQTVYGLEDGWKYEKGYYVIDNKKSYFERYYDSLGYLVGEYIDDKKIWIDPNGKIINHPRNKS